MAHTKTEPAHSIPMSGLKKFQIALAEETNGLHQVALRYRSIISSKFAVPCSHAFSV
jgi:hypothetical protein